MTSTDDNPRALRPREELPAKYRSALDLSDRRSPARAILDAIETTLTPASDEPRSREGMPAQYRAALDLWEGRPSPYHAILEAALRPIPDDIANSRGH
jgi:hypothetical protein